MLGPTFWGPGSELFGRQPIFVGCLAMYTLFHIGQACASNMTTLLVTRFICGFFAVAPLTNGSGVIADKWDPVNLGIATSVFASAVFLGPVLGAIVGSFITTISPSAALGLLGTDDLRGLLYAPRALLPPRDFRPCAPHTESEALAQGDSREEQGPLHGELNRSCCLRLTMCLSVVYGVIYAMFQAIPVIFIHTRHFPISNDGLIFIGIGIGSILATVVNLWFLRPYRRLLKQWYGFPPAEERIYSAMLGGPVQAVGIFWLGWSGNYESVPWWVPRLCTILIGLAITLIFISFISYLVDTYLMYAASALAWPDGHPIPDAR